MSSGIYTMPEYLRERFGGQRIRIYLSVLALILYVFTKISADLYAGALFIQEAVGQTSDEWLYISVVILLLIAALFTIAGGLTAVIWTDFIQTVLMIIGSFILMMISFYQVGGYEKMTEDYFYAIPENVSEQYSECAKPPYYALNLFRPIAPGASDLPWTGMVLGITITSTWYWCTDQVIVQRALASRNMIHAKSGCLLAAFLKFFPIWLLVFPGMCARILFPNEVACVEPESCKKICGSTTGCTNVAYIKLVLELLPTGLRGLMLAVMMAALMSSLTSIFNSSSTIFTIDIWERIRRNHWKKMNSRMVEIEKLIVGRAFVLVLVVISVIWIPVIQNSSNSQLFVYIQSVSSFLSPPICAVYALAIFWKRTNEPGAFWGLMIGLILGMVRFVLEFSYVVPSCGSDLPDPRPEIIKILVGNIHYLHFSIILFFVTLAVSVSVSMATEPIPDKCVSMQIRKHI
ncbi:UNVERIFIED_CONTAM: hypothetical protein GTU68_031820 [Idotea baltica]|nr:hypothetical protein [Idotea baltica]